MSHKQAIEQLNDLVQEIRDCTEAERKKALRDLVADQAEAKPSDTDRPNLRPCPFCGGLPKIERLGGFDTIQHVNSECPISPVFGWSLCVWKSGIGADDNSVGEDKGRHPMKTSIYVSIPTLGAIIRPTRPNCVGRTLLTPECRSSIPGVVTTCTENVSIQGLILPINGFPFITQDCDVTVCGHAALWMALRYFSNRYSEYSEKYPFELLRLTAQHARERIYPSRGLQTWQMAMALREAGFSPVIYHRDDYKDEFEHLLYTYVESGIPLVITFERHAAVAFGHISDYKKRLTPKDGSMRRSSDFNTGIVIHDDNQFPYQVLSRRKGKGPLDSEYRFQDIESFVAPLAEKIFLSAEEFESLALELLQGKRFGYAACSPELKRKKLMLRIFLTSCRSFKARLRERGMGNSLVSEVYANLPMPHFIWVCELAVESRYVKSHEVLGEVIWDATRNALEEDGWLALHYPEKLIVNVGASANESRDLAEFPLQDSSDYPLYRSNLKPMKGVAE